MKLIQQIGLGLFLIALIVFGAVSFMADYKITPESINQASTQFGGDYKPYILNEFKAIEGNTYNSKLDLFSDIDDAAKRATEKMIVDGQPEYVQSNFSKYYAKTYKQWMAHYSAIGFFADYKSFLIFIVFGLGVLGALMWIVPQFWEGAPGIKNNGIYHSSATSRGWLGYVAGVYFIGFYVLLYFMPHVFTETIALTDPIAHWFGPNDASQWFMYGVLYTIAVIIMGLRMFAKYRHNKYQLIRTVSVIFFQLGFAFLLPNLLAFVNGVPSYDLKNIWPLDYSLFYDWRVNEYLASKIGVVMFIFGIALFLFGVPILTYLYGKRWYCSWVCGCGGLAETLGDPYRQLSDKSLKAWKVERYLIYIVLVFAVVMTVFVLYHTITGVDRIIGISAYSIREIYGLLISSIFAGVVGTGLYPILGNRVWCRYGCPLAAIMGIVQKFKSRFRITTNADQCISCGNCSTYCEQGIDVKWYAQRGQNIVRASCVGCGVCAAVCPRGVLRLENGDDNVNRKAIQAINIVNDDVIVNS